MSEKTSHQPTRWQRFTDYIRKHRTLSIIVVAAFVLLVFFFWRAVAAGRQALQNAYQTETVERGTLTAMIGATGSVRANQSAVLNWGASGTVEFVNAAVGDQVATDDILASLELSSLPQNVILANADLQDAQDNLDLEVAQAAQALADAQDALDTAQRDLYNLTHPGKDVDIDQAYANMVLAKDKLDKAQDDYDPYADKPEDNLVRANYLLRLTEAQKAYDSAVRTYNAYSGTANTIDIAVAQAKVTLAESQLSVAQRDYDNAQRAADLDYTSPAEARVAAAEATLDLAHIQAPFDGVVTDAHPSIGDVVTAGTRAFRLDDLSRLLVDVDVSEVDINRVALGQEATLTFDAAPDSEYHGTVTAVALAGDTTGGAVNFRVTVELTDADESVRPGMTAAVNIVVTQLQDVLLVPNRAVRIIGGQRVVYILENGQLVPVAIQLGATSEVSSEVIDGDLQIGDVVVLNPPAPSAFNPGEPPPAFIQQNFNGPGND